MRLHCIRADPRSITPHQERFRSFPEIYVFGAPQMFTGTIPVYFGHAGLISGFLLRLGWSPPDDLIGIAGGRAQTKLAKYFFTIGFFVNYTIRIIVICIYDIIRLHFLVDWDFLQVHIFILIGFAVVLVYHGPQG